MSGERAVSKTKKIRRHTLLIIHFVLYRIGYAVRSSVHLLEQFFQVNPHLINFMINPRAASKCRIFQSCAFFMLFSQSYSTGS